MSLFSDKTNDNTPDILDKAISESLTILTNALVKETTNFGKNEVKQLSILKQNKYIQRIIKDYPIYKKQLNNNFEKSIQNAIEKYCNAIANRHQQENENDLMSKLKFWKRT